MIDKIEDEPPSHHRPDFESEAGSEANIGPEAMDLELPVDRVKTQQASHTMLVTSDMLG